MKKIGIVVLHWNNFQDTQNCLNSVIKLDSDGNKIEIVLVDNASTNDSLVKLKQEFKQVKFIENKSNLGFAEGNNVGIDYFKKEKFDYIFLLNNDTLVSTNLIKELIKTQQETQAGIVSPKIYFTKGYEYHKNRYKENQRGNVIWYAGGKINWNTVLGYHIGVDEVDDGQFNNQREIEYATGAAMFVNYEAITKLGGFDKRYYLYYEDIDFCLRAKKENFKIIYSPKAILWHNNAGSSSSGSLLQDYYITRNRLLFAKTYASFKVNMHLKKEALMLILNGRKWQKRGVIDYFLGNFGKGSYE